MFETVVIYNYNANLLELQVKLLLFLPLVSAYGTKIKRYDKFHK